jgi:hypothetical protein
MLKALWYKELRETLGIALAALLAYLAFVAHYTGYAVLPFWVLSRDGWIPFLEGQFTSAFCFVSVCFAIGLGLRQTAFESGRGTWPFLLHRPMSLRRLIGAKLAAGLGVYLVCGAIPILIYAAWAATPGTHASPFQWWMTVPVWKAWIAIIVVYLGAFLAGIRPGRWIGTRLLPLPTAGLLAALAGAAPWRCLLGIPPLLLVLVCGCLVSFILFVARARDYS